MKDQKKSLSLLLIALMGLGLLMARPAQAADELFPPAEPEDVGMCSKQLETALQVAHEWVEEQKIMGGTLLVIRDGKRVMHESFGWRDFENDVPMSDDTIFHIASMAKTMTGTAVLQLYEQGKFDLEDRVSKYLPQMDTPQTREITIYQLLTHTSGLGSWSGLSADTHERMVEKIAEQGPVHEPGTQFQYRDRNSAVLGYLVEVISGQPLIEYLQEHIFEPLELHDTYARVAEDDPRLDRVGPGYRGSGSGTLRRWQPGRGIDREFLAGSTAVHSTVDDYARLLEAYRQGGRLGDARILDSQLVELAMDRHAERPDGMYDYGLHWGVGIHGVSPNGIAHGGARGTLAYFDDEEDLMILFFTQTERTPVRVPMMGLVHDALEPREDLIISDAVGSERVELSAGDHKSDLGRVEVTEDGVEGDRGRLAIEAGAVLENAGRSYVGVGSDSHASASVSDDGSQWHSQATVVGRYGGTGTLHIENGGVIETESRVAVGQGDPRLPDNDGTSGKATVTNEGSSWQVGERMDVGRSGATGELAISNGGRVLVRGQSSIGSGAIAQEYDQTEGVLEVRGENATLEVEDWLEIGREHGHGTLLIDDGGEVVVQQLRVGMGGVSETITAEGIATISGDSSTLEAESTQIGRHRGRGELIIENGAQAELGNLSIGRGQEAGDHTHGRLIIRGQNTHVNADWMRPGRPGSGRVELHDGATLVNNGAVRTGAGESAHGEVYVGPGSTWITKHRTQTGRGSDATGRIIIDGGTLTVTEGEGIEVGREGGDKSSFGTLLVKNGGSVSADLYAQIGRFSSAKGLAVIKGEDSRWTNHNTIYIGGDSEGSSGIGALSISDNARVVLDANDPDDRTVRVWQDTGTLAGSGGTLEANVINEGRVIPGAQIAADGGGADAELTESFDTPSVLAIEGDYTQRPTGSLAIQLTETDQTKGLQVTGEMKLAGRLELDLAKDFDLQPGDRFILMGADTIADEFDELIVPNDGLEWSLQYEDQRVILEIDEE